MEYKCKHCGNRVPEGYYTSRCLKCGKGDSPFSKVLDKYEEAQRHKPYETLADLREKLNGY